VQHIVRAWRMSFAQNVAMKFNCFFLLPFMDEFPFYLRSRLDKMYDVELASIFDLSDARTHLQQRLQDLAEEAEANRRLQAKFEDVNRMINKGRISRGEGDAAELEAEDIVGGPLPPPPPMKYSVEEDEMDDDEEEEEDEEDDDEDDDDDEASWRRSIAEEEAARRSSRSSSSSSRRQGGRRTRPRSSNPPSPVKDFSDEEDVAVSLEEEDDEGLDMEEFGVGDSGGWDDEEDGLGDWWLDDDEDNDEGLI